MDTQKLIATIDDLQNYERDALEMAALLGDNFSLDNLLDLINIKPSQLFDLIDLLLRKHLIKDKSGSIKGEYVFTHEQFSALVIQSMENVKKQLYLSNIIQYLERKYSDKNEKAKVLVQLILDYKNELDDINYIKQAADLLVNDHQSDRAIKLYREIIESLFKKDRDTVEDVLFIESVIAYAKIAININPPTEIIPIINEALHLSVKLDNKRAETVLELFLGRLYQRQGNQFETAASHYNRGWELANQLDDDELRRISSKLYASSLFWEGRITQAIQQYEDTLENVEDIDPELRDVWAYLMLALCYAKRGRIGRGLGLANAVMERAEALGYTKTIAFSHSIISVILLDVKRFKEAEPHVDKAIHIGHKIRSDFALYVGNISKAYLEYERGNITTARDLFEEGLKHVHDTTSVHYPSPWTVEVLWGFQKSKVPEIKNFTFKSETKRILSWPNIYMKGVALRYQALADSESSIDDIEKQLKQSRDLLQEAGASVELGITYVELSKLYIKKDELIKAKEAAESAFRELSAIDTNLFPPQLSYLIVQDSIESSKNEGIKNLEQAISHLPDLEKYIGRVVTILTEMFGAERTAILLLQQDDHTTLTVAAARNFTNDEIAKLREEELQSYLMEILRGEDPIIISKQIRRSILNQLAKHGINARSIALTPIWSEGGLIGLIYTDNSLFEGIFSKEDKILLKSISGQLTIAIKTCRLHKKFDNLHIYLTEDKQQPPSPIPSTSPFPTIVGKSRAIKEILLNVKKVAGLRTAVLIQGETGVGKELIARAIHRDSNRFDKPLVIVNISALSDTLITSELFGHEKGAYTGAITSKPGRFELADGGTIFLDEIGELTMEAQVKLLRVLQEGKFERVGGNKPIYSDFRVIAATNKKLNEMAKKGEFRSDLFYRISSFPIEIPPLRERPEDIPELTLHFMKKYATKNRKKINRILTDDIERLQSYEWPGNVRELEHFIERAVIITPGGNLVVPEIEPPYKETSLILGENEGGLQPLENIQRMHIIRVLKHTNWKIRGEDGAAKILGLKPTTLEFRIKKLKIR